MNQNIKALIISLVILAEVPLHAGRDANIINCCTVGGMTAVMNNCSCTVNVQSGSSGTRARGDIVMMNLADVSSERLQTQGTIKIPDVGSIDRYRFGAHELIFATFSLKNPKLNPAGLSPALKTIISRAGVKHKWAQTMVWVGQVLPGQARLSQKRVVELNETYVDQSDLSQAPPISYRVLNANTLQVNIPATTRSKAETITARFKNSPLARPTSERITGRVERIMVD